MILSVATGIRENPKNNKYEDIKVINSFAELLDAVRFDHMAGTFKENHRHNNNFISADAVVMDVDNNHSDNHAEWLMPEAFQGFACAVIYSRNHMKQKGNYSARTRFHVYFRLSREYTTAGEITGLKEAILRAWPKFDDGAKDAARFIFGVENPDGHEYTGAFIDTYLQEQNVQAMQESENQAMNTNEQTANQEYPEGSNNTAMNQTTKNFSEVIPDGHRNNTMYDRAIHFRLTNSDRKTALKLFRNEAKKCSPVLSDQELITIWNSAMQSDNVRLYEAALKHLSQCDNEQKAKNLFANEFAGSLTANKKEDVFNSAVDVLHPKSDAEKNAKDNLAKRDEFLAANTLMFYGSIQRGIYYHYDSAKGYWYSLPDAVIQHKIADHFGQKLGARKINELTALIRLKITQELPPVFNKLPLMGFKNGVLELDGGKFREYSPNDLLTWQVDYDYKNEAKCDRFESFLDEITDAGKTDIGNTRKDFIINMIAYILYPDCRLHKMFFLIGEGNNGKSTLLQIIEALFRNTNPHENSASVTDIEPKDFKDPTKVIMLENSLVNIASEINPNLRGSEITLKSVAAGDRITGNLKYRDTHSFRSRAKLISACNSMPLLQDNSVGMKRRLMFCRFPVSFEGKADTQLLEKLKAERSGIFNLVYRAYMAMIEREKTSTDMDVIFPKCIDQTAQMHEFSLNADPVAAFWDEKSEEYLERKNLFEQVEIKKDEVFTDFQQWLGNDKARLNSSNFHKAFQQAIREQGFNCETIRQTIDGKRDYYYIITRIADEVSNAILAGKSIDFE